MSDERFSPARRRAAAARLSRVEGWLHPLSAQAIMRLLLEQSAHGVVGSVGEIGVHHGRSFIPMYACTAARETAVAVDIFGLQRLNVDGSGCGSKARFLRNIDRLLGSRDGLEIVESSSLEVTPAGLADKAAPFRFFSIDGGHTYECTRHDLDLAEATLMPAGIVMLDDLFNEHWPDVSMAAATYLHSHAARLVPFAITPNKVFLCRPEHAAAYRQSLRRALPPANFLKVSRMGVAAVDVYFQRDALWRRARRRLARIRRSLER